MKKIQKLKKGKFQKLLLATTMAIMTFANKVQATDIVSEVEGGGSIQSSKLGQGLLNIVRDVTGTIQWILPITGVCFILFYIFKIMTGDEQDQQRYKKSIIKVLVCIVIGLLAVTIVNLIARYFSKEEMKMTDKERLKNRLEEIQKEEKNKESKEKEYMEEMKTNEEKRLENEKQRKKLREEEEKLQQNFSNKLGSDVAQSKKLFGFLKRYVLIGIVTGVPGIALTYLWDKWQENKMVKDLYEKNIELVANPNNKDLAKEYELLRRKFYKAYDIDKIERLVKTSEDIEKLKNDNKLLEKLNEEIRK